MARQPRIDLPEVPQHLIQRGNNRQPCFFADDDRLQYLEWLHQAAREHGGSVHAYVLMSNHVHLVATGAEIGSLGRVMQSLGRRYVRHINSRYQRTGSLWEGRYRSSLIDSDRYLLTCYRYVELNPVRAGIVNHPGDYRWSSYNFNASGKKDELITPHASYLSLGKASGTRLSADQRLFRTAMSEGDLKAIRDHANQGKVLGSESFITLVEETLNRRVRWAPAGRPVSGM